MDYQEEVARYQENLLATLKAAGLTDIKLEATTEVPEEVIARMMINSGDSREETMAFINKYHCAWAKLTSKELSGLVLIFPDQNGSNLCWSPTWEQRRQLERIFPEDAAYDTPLVILPLPDDLEVILSLVKPNVEKTEAGTEDVII